MNAGEFLHSELDYTGTFREVVSRVPKWVLDELSQSFDMHDDSLYLYFGLRRYAVEIGTPGEIPNMNLDLGGKIHFLAVRLLAIKRMELEGKIVVHEWPPEPFNDPLAPLSMSATEKGKVYHKALEAKANASQPGPQAPSAPLPGKQAAHRAAGEPYFACPFCGGKGCERCNQTGVQETE